MDHDHSFPRESDDVEWDEDRDVLIVKRNCQQTIRDNNPVSGGFTPGGHGSTRERQCEANRKTVYEIRSVTDNHDQHSLDCSSVVVSEDGYVSDSSKHVSELEETPEWVEDITSRVKHRAREHEHIGHVTTLAGKQFYILVATSDSEYNVTFDKVEEWVEE